MSSELETLISAVCDNRATEQELVRLAGLLRVDPIARDIYLRYVDLHSALSDEALPAFESDIVDYRFDSILPLAEGSNNGARMSLNRWLALAASIIVIVGLGFLALHQPAQKVSGDNASPFAVALPVATMLLTEDCRWSRIGWSEGDRLNPGRVDLESGTAVLRFDGGAELVVVGPATMDLQSSASVVVHVGDIVVRATDGAEGFVVMTPTSEVVDLGTEFAVKVSHSGATEVHVLDGKVSYRVINTADELSEILRAGEGVAIDEQGSPNAVPMNSPRFQEFVNRVNPRSRSDLLTAYEGFNYSPGILSLEESTVGKGWAGPWRKRLPSERGSSNERRKPAADPSPAQIEIVHGQMNVTWPVPGGRLGAFRIPSGGAYYIRPLKQGINLGGDDVTFFSLMVRETELGVNSVPSNERLRLTFRSSENYFGQAICFGHGSHSRPFVQTGEGVVFTSPLLMPFEQTTLWIGKLVSRKQGEDEVYFRVYGEGDVLDYAEPATWHVVTRGADLDADLDLVLISSEGETDRLVDELRIGPTWRSVAPIEEGRE